MGGTPNPDIRWALLGNHLYLEEQSSNINFSITLTAINSQELWSEYDLTSTILLWVLHGKEEVEMTHYDAQDHADPTAYALWRVSPHNALLGRTYSAPRMKKKKNSTHGKYIA